MSNKFLMVSLQEDKARHISQVLSNASCRKILDYLSEREATESELAKKLGIPISTAHYNITQLVKSNLVVAEEFHYSKKGKEVLHYKLANKYIIIAPRSTHGIKTKLKSIIPAVLIIALGGGFLQWFSRFLIPSIGAPAVRFGGEVMEAAKASAPAIMEGAADMAATTGIPDAVSTAAPAVEEAAASNFWNWIGVWFIIGGILALGLYLLIDYLMSKRKNK